MVIGERWGIWNSDPHPPRRNASASPCQGEAIRAERDQLDFPCSSVAMRPVCKTPSRIDSEYLLQVSNRLFDSACDVGVLGCGIAIGGSGAPGAWGRALRSVARSQARLLRG